MELNNVDPVIKTLLDTIVAASKLPFVYVDRETFLRNQFKGSKHIETILESGPQTVFNTEFLLNKADQIIEESTRNTSLVSFAAGLPSNPLTMFAAGGADIIQNYGFAINLIQQIAYLFGEEKLFTQNEELSEESKTRIIVYLGVMSGANGASQLISKVAKPVGQNIGKKVASMALTKTAWYPMFKSVAKVLGIQVTKKSVGTIISKAVPIIGGVISGGLTFVTFKPMGKRLALEFANLQKETFNEDDFLTPEFLAKINNDDTIEGEFEEL